jgi:hypothetical protein
LHDLQEHAGQSVHWASSRDGGWFISFVTVVCQKAELLEAIRTDGWLLQYIGFRRTKDGKYFGNNIPDEPAFTDIAADSSPNDQL